MTFLPKTFLLARKPTSPLQWLEDNFDADDFGQMRWYRGVGIGWLAPEQWQIEYGREYFDEFEAKSQTDLGKAIMQARVELVARHYHGLLCDVGIGSGAFINTRAAMTCGWDINPVAIAWLSSRKLLLDPSAAYFPAVSLWDVLEHISDFSYLLNNVLHWVFLSLPIFRDSEHVLGSKHFKPGEHCWYFTRDGLQSCMRYYGFECVEQNQMETQLGREDIGSFAFRRIDAS